MLKKPFTYRLWHTDRDLHLSLEPVLQQSGLPFRLYLCDVNCRDPSNRPKSGQTTYRSKWGENIYISSPKKKFVGDLEGQIGRPVADQAQSP